MGTSSSLARMASNSSMVGLLIIISTKQCFITLHDRTALQDISAKMFRTSGRRQTPVFAAPAAHGAGAACLRQFEAAERRGMEARAGGGVHRVALEWSEVEPA